MQLPSRTMRVQASWSLAGTVAGAVASLVGVKLISIWIPAEAFGRASLILGLVALANGVLVGPIGTAGQRLYFEYRNRGLAVWFLRQLDRALVGGVSLSVAFYFAAVALTGATRQESILTGTALAATVLAGQTLQTRLVLCLEVRREQRALALASSLSRILVPVTLLCLVLAGTHGATAVVVSQALGPALVGLTWRRPREEPGQGQCPASPRSAAMECQRNFVAFGWSLPLGWVAMWGVTTSARYVLERHVPLATVGVYTMNLGLWMALFSLLNGWMETLTRPLVYSYAAGGDIAMVTRVTMGRFALCVSATALVLAALPFVGRGMLPWLLGRAYLAETPAGRLFVVASGLQAAGYALVSALLALRRTIWMTGATLLAAAVNITASWALVPRWGLTGAAVANVAAYVAWNGTLGLLVWAALQHRRPPTQAAVTA